jgi:hypothetical protein
MLWAAIQTLDAARQYEFLRELAYLYASSAENPRTIGDKIRAAVVALRQAAELLGYSPSVKEYRRLRRQLPDLKLPPDGSIRRWLGGGWNDCLTSSLLDAVSDGDFAAPRRGINERYSRKDIAQALRECAADLGRAPTLTAYLHWARRPDVSDRPGRRPRSYHPFDRIGGFRVALSAAKVIDDDAARVGSDGRVLPLRYSYSEPEMKSALRCVAERIGRSPRPTDYVRERQRISEEAFAAGKVHGLPSPEVLRKHFGSWNAALAAVELEPVATPFRPFRANPRPTYSLDEKLEWLRRARIEVGEPFTEQAYRNWREERLSVEGAIPSAFTLAKAFGGWVKARERALPEATMPSEPRAQ